MQKLLFVFGRNKELSMLELAGFFTAEKTNYSILEFSKDFALLELEDSFNAANALKNIAGSLKVCKVLLEEEIPENDFSKLEKKLEETDFTAEFGKKFYYTLNNYGSEAGEELMDFLLDYFKQKFKSEKLKAMLKWPKEIEGKKKNSISPTMLAKRLEKEHLDLFFIEKQGKAILGKTIAVGNPALFAERDTQRPAVKHELVTSVRLARILVNLAGVEKGKTILDPFCGIGGIMQEILLSGHNAIGVDASAENAKACEENLEWAAKKYSIQKQFRIINQDSRRLSGFLKQESFQAVVTEPYLGPFLKKLPSLPTAEKNAKELESLYATVFKELSKLLAKESRIVFIMPCFPTIQGKKVRIPERVFLNNGFRKANPLEKELPNALPFEYKDSESRIERLIYLLEKV